MTRTNRRALSHLDELGGRLRSLRIRAGLSQMELARAIGFNPTHGYKYILRLEKGLVPNPTLRTVANILDATHASWQDIVDVLPQVSAVTSPRKENPTVLADSAQRAATQTPPAPSQRGQAPLREWLRQQRLSARQQLSRTHWQRAAAAVSKIEELLAGRPDTSPRRRDYLLFLRKTLSTLTVFLGTRPQLLQQALKQVLEEGTAQQLDRELLSQIQQVCRETVSD
ncbi:MAG: helix-turn-helix transcriptional regulator [candidate division WOR-3 bacterium]